MKDHDNKILEILKNTPNDELMELWKKVKDKYPNSSSVDEYFEQAYGNNDKFNYINTLIKEFVEESEGKQGYINISTFNGFHEKMYGEVSYRGRMGGSPDGYFQYKSLDDLIEQIEILIDRIIIYTYKDLN